MEKSKKAVSVKELTGVFGEIETIIITQNTGLTVAEFTKLRQKVRASGASIKVAKNRLVRIALKGTRYEALSDKFHGPTAIAYSKDPVSAAKAIAEFAKDNAKLVIIGGAMGNTILDVAGVKNLASMPSLDELRAKLIGLLNAPATKLVQVIQAPAGQLARIFGAYAAKG